MPNQRRGLGPASRIHTSPLNRCPHDPLPLAPEFLHPRCGRPFAEGRRGDARMPELAEREIDEVVDHLVEGDEREVVENLVASRSGPAAGSRIVRSPDTILRPVSHRDICILRRVGATNTRCTWCLQVQGPGGIRALPQVDIPEGQWSSAGVRIRRHQTEVAMTPTGPDKGDKPERSSGALAALLLSPLMLLARGCGPEARELSKVCAEAERAANEMGRAGREAHATRPYSPDMESAIRQVELARANASLESAEREALARRRVGRIQQDVASTRRIERPQVDTARVVTPVSPAEEMAEREGRLAELWAGSTKKAPSQSPHANSDPGTHEGTHAHIESDASAHDALQAERARSEELKATRKSPSWARADSNAKTAPIEEGAAQLGSTLAELHRTRFFTTGRGLLSEEVARIARDQPGLHAEMVEAPANRAMDHAEGTTWAMRVFARVGWTTWDSRSNRERESKQEGK